MAPQALAERTPLFATISDRFLSGVVELGKAVQVDIRLTLG